MGVFRDFSKHTMNSYSFALQAQCQLRFGPSSVKTSPVSWQESSHSGCRIPLIPPCGIAKGKSVSGIHMRRAPGVQLNEFLSSSRKACRSSAGFRSRREESMRDAPK